MFLDIVHGSLEHLLETASMEYVVSKDHAHAVTADELLSDDECLRKAVRRRLLRICEAHAVVRAIAKQATE